MSLGSSLVPDGDSCIGACDEAFHALPSVPTAASVTWPVFSLFTRKRLSRLSGSACARSGSVIARSRSIKIGAAYGSLRSKDRRWARFTSRPLGLAPVDSDPVLVERMGHLTVVYELAKRLRIGSRLYSDRDEECCKLLWRQMEIRCCDPQPTVPIDRPRLTFLQSIPASSASHQHTAAMMRTHSHKLESTPSIGPVDAKIFCPVWKRAQASSISS